MMQDGEGIRVSGAATQGGSITVNVGPNDSTVEVGVQGTSGHTTHPVPGGKDTAIPVPPVPAGTILIVKVGKGARMRRIEVEVIAPGP
jgi:hypothetical protein